MAGNSIRISIIGAEASGIISTHQLVDKLSKKPSQKYKIRIYIFDKSGAFGPGLAYRTPLKSHLINMRSGTMSAILDKPDDFVEWIVLQEKYIQKDFHELAVGGSEYVPRTIYGRYLSDLGQRAFEQAKENDIEIEFVEDEVLDIKDNGEEKKVLLKNGMEVRTDYVILALGNFPPTISLELRGLEGYFPYP